MDKQAHLIIPVGPPAAGKSVLAQWLVAEGFPLDGIVCPDDIRRIMTGDQTDQRANDQVFQVADLLIQQRLRHGLDVFVDATNLGEGRRDFLFNEGHGSNATIIIVLFDTTPEECLRRNSHRSREVPAHIMKRMLDAYSGITKHRLVDEAGWGTDVYYPAQFMAYRWDFLNS